MSVPAARQPEPPPQRASHLRGVPPQPPPQYPVPRYTAGDPSQDPLCAEHPRREQLWFSEMRTAADLRNAKEAAQLCTKCPVLIRCREWAEYYKPYSGIWGAVAYVRNSDNVTGRPAARDLLQ